MNDTIFAHSSGGLPSGVAIIRISGPNSRIVIETMCDDVQFGNRVCFRKIRNPENHSIIDEGLVLTFKGPNSFTGEDVVELQVHGGRAIIGAILASLAILDGFRVAEAGEFTYRAFENGKLDLTQVEGIADLIASESEAQRKLAYGAAEGKARTLIEGWSQQLLQMRALVEAEIDFVDEDDIPGSVSDEVWAGIEDLINEIKFHLDHVNDGEIIRSGFRVALLGKPNSGKSTLINCLAGRDVAIVTDIPGTTRDVLEVKLNVGGQVVIISDTAGIHLTSDVIEQEGIKRAYGAAGAANMSIWLHGADDKDDLGDPEIDIDLIILSKSDRLQDDKKTLEPGNQIFDLQISSHNEEGVDELIARINETVQCATSGSEDIVFSRERHLNVLNLVLDSLIKARDSADEGLEIKYENLRVASDCLGRLTGRVDVEDILGVIFSEFCVGK